MKMNLGLLLALPMVTLAIGIAIGTAVARPTPIETTPIETDVIPPPSLKNRAMAQDFCVRSSVFADLSKADEHEKKRFDAHNVWVMPISDRGAICIVEGTLITKHGYSESATVMTKQIKTTFIVAITGESEVVTEEFAKALVRSTVISGMASNKGNDGTVVPKVKLNF